MLIVLTYWTSRILLVLKPAQLDDFLKLYIHSKLLYIPKPASYTYIYINLVNYIPINKSTQMSFLFFLKFLLRIQSGGLGQFNGIHKLLDPGSWIQSYLMGSINYSIGSGSWIQPYFKNLKGLKDINI